MFFSLAPHYLFLYVRSIMASSIYICILGISQSRISDLKQAIVSHFSFFSQIHLTHITDKDLQVLFINEDLFDTILLQICSRSQLKILKLSKNEQYAGQIINNVLYFYLSSTYALLEWLSQTVCLDDPSIEENITTPISPDVRQQYQLSYQTIAKAFEGIANNYPKLSKFIIKTGGATLSFFDLKTQEMYINNTIQIRDINGFEIVPVDLNSIVNFKKQFKPKDLSQAIWQLVWDNVIENLPIYTILSVIGLASASSANTALNSQDYFNQGSLVQHVQPKMGLSLDVLNRYLFACDIAKMIREIPLEHALSLNVTSTASDYPIQKESSLRGFFNILRKKLGI